MDPMKRAIFLNRRTLSKRSCASLEVASDTTNDGEPPSKSCVPGVSSPQKGILFCDTQVHLWFIFSTSRAFVFLFHQSKWNALFSLSRLLAYHLHLTLCTLKRLLAAPCVSVHHNWLFSFHRPSCVVLGAHTCWSDGSLEFFLGGNS